MANPMTYSEIREAVGAIVKQTTGKKDTVINYLINMVYLNEILSIETAHPLFWLVQQKITTYSVPPVAVSSITQNNPGLITTDSAHQLSAGDIIVLWAVLGMTTINGILVRVMSVPTTTTFTINLDTTNLSAYTSGGYVYHHGITLPHATDRILTAGWGNKSDRITLLTPKQIEEQGTDNHPNGSTGLPVRAYHGQDFSNDGTHTDQFVWFPASDASYLLRYWYVISPSRLSDDGDVPLLPSRFHDVIVSGVVARLLEPKDRPNATVENSSLWPTIYTVGLEAIRNYNERYWANVENNMPVTHYMS